MLKSFLQVTLAISRVVLCPWCTLLTECQIIGSINVLSSTCGVQGVPLRSCQSVVPVSDSFLRR